VYGNSSSSIGLYGSSGSSTSAGVYAVNTSTTPAPALELGSGTIKVPAGSGTASNPPSTIVINAVAGTIINFTGTSNWHTVSNSYVKANSIIFVTPQNYGTNSFAIGIKDITNGSFQIWIPSGPGPDPSSRVAFLVINQ
jgi:hypothetical protein